MRIRVLPVLGFFLALLFLAGEALAAPEAPPGARLIRENNCAACHRIGTGPAPRQPPRVGPDLARAGQRLEAGWLMDYLRAPRELRPANPARMPDFRLSGAEAAALAAYLMTRRAPWPEPPAEEREKGEEGPVGFAALFQGLPPGDAGRGRRLFEQYECAKCHGDPARPGAPPAGKPEERGPDLREMARKLTRRGIASMLFQPGLIHKNTKMPAFFFDQGEAMDDSAPRQMADVAAYVRSLRKGAAPLPPPAGGDPQAGRALALRLNCAGCHDGTGLSPRPQAQVAIALGYRNAPPQYTPAVVADWIRRPRTIAMHERMHGLGRMPTFGFSAPEAEQIARYLFSIDGPPRRGGGMMMQRGMRGGMMRAVDWLLRLWERLSGAFR